MHHFIFPTQDNWVSSGSSTITGESFKDQNFGRDQILEVKKEFYNSSFNFQTRALVQFTGTEFTEMSQSIVKKDILEAFKDKILNVHLGISPYYLGSGTNFISLLNNDFQCVGYTLMYMDSGIDTGEIIHQSRAKIFQFDNIHQIGNRLIKDMTSDFIYLVNNFHLVKKMSYPDIQHESIICLNKHVTVDAVKKIYKSFSDGGVENFLKWCKENDISMAVCTNKQERLAIDLLKKIGIYDYFEYVAGHDTFDFCKPDPRHLTNVIEILDGDIKKSLMFGDSESDANAARDASIPVFLLENGYTEKKTSEIYHNHLIKDFIGVEKIVSTYLKD